MKLEIKEKLSQIRLVLKEIFEANRHSMFGGDFTEGPSIAELTLRKPKEKKLEGEWKNQRHTP